MKNSPLTEEDLRRELFYWNVDVHDKYLIRYENELHEFIASMAGAHYMWKEFDETIGVDEQLAHVSCLIFQTSDLHFTSTKLLTWGLLVPAGSIMRQVIENIALVFLVSKPRLGYLRLYASSRYSTNHAVRDVIKNHKKLNLDRSALEILKQSRDWYNRYSHPTFLAASNLIQLKGSKTYFGSSFDPSKKFAYDKEVSTRVQVAGLLENMIYGARHNLASAE